MVCTVLPTEHVLCWFYRYLLQAYKAFIGESTACMQKAIGFPQLIPFRRRDFLKEWRAEFTGEWRTPSSIKPWRCLLNEFYVVSICFSTVIGCVEKKTVDSTSNLTERSLPIHNVSCRMRKLANERSRHISTLLMRKLSIGDWHIRSLSL